MRNDGIFEGNQNSTRISKVRAQKSERVASSSRQKSIRLGKNPPSVTNTYLSSCLNSSVSRQESLFQAMIPNSEHQENESSNEMEKTFYNEPQDGMNILHCHSLWNIIFVRLIAVVECKKHI